MADTNETTADIIAKMRSDGHTGPADTLEWVRIKLEHYADRLEAALKREVDALKQRINELDAEIAAKDEVIKRLNDAIAEEQMRKMATAEKSSAVGDCAKLPKTVDLRFDICKDIKLVLKIGRDFQNKDGFRGAHYDTVKLLCDAIEYQQEQLKAKTEVGDAAKLREALEKCANWGEQIDCQLGSSDETVYAFRDERCLAYNISECARAALAAPPRNSTDSQSANLHGRRCHTQKARRRNAASDLR